MAVNVQMVELIAPLGELSAHFFPDGDMDALLGPWLTQAKAKVIANTKISGDNQATAIKQWVYYLAYTHIAGRYASMPNSVSVNKGADSVSYGQDRPAFWAARASAALAAYNLLPSEAVKADSRQSVTIPFRVVY